MVSLRYLLDTNVISEGTKPVPNQAAQWHATERARLIKIGRTPAFFDGQIASIAYCNGLTLVTHNVGDFQDFYDLNVENWFSLEG